MAIIFNAGKLLLGKFEPLDSRESFQVTEQFVEELPDGRIKQGLADALSTRRSFLRFKDTLCEYPEVRKQWFAFHNQALKKVAQEWLEYKYTSMPNCSRSQRNKGKKFT